MWEGVRYLDGGLGRGGLVLRIFFGMVEGRKLLGFVVGVGRERNMKRRMRECEGSR